MLATFILFLAVKPVMVLLLLQPDTEQTCCGKQCIPTSDNDHSQNQNENNDCDGKSCNPFQVCNSCVLVCFHIPLISIPIPAIFLEDGIYHQVIFTSQFAPDFWQPPKIV